MILTLMFFILEIKGVGIISAAGLSAELPVASEWPAVCILSDTMSAIMSGELAERYSVIAASGSSSSSSMFVGFRSWRYVSGAKCFLVAKYE